MVGKKRGLLKDGRKKLLGEECQIIEIDSVSLHKMYDEEILNAYVTRQT